MIMYSSLYFMWYNYQKLDYLFNTSLSNNLIFSFNFICKYILVVMTVVFVIAISDTLFQYFQYFNSLKMTVREVRDEYKALEGNPLTKQRAQSLAQKLSNHSIISEFIQSDVIIFNTMNYAIAIQYVPTSMLAPRILTKGSGDMALRMIEVAKKNNIPVFISDSFVTYLYYNSSIGNYIPSNSHQSIAKILSWAWRLKRWQRRGGVYPAMPIISFDIE